MTPRADLRTPHAPRRRRGPINRLARLASSVAALSLVALLPGALPAHEIPARVAVTALARLEAERLTVVLRVPLAAMRDLDLPLRADGTLAVSDGDAALRTAAATWLGASLTVREDGRSLGAPAVGALRLAAPSAAGFANVREALARLAAPPDTAGRELRFETAWLDVVLTWPVADVSADFVLEPAFAHLGVRTSTVLAVERGEGAPVVYRFEGNPGTIALDPRWSTAAGRFAAEGVHHILGGLDHLLFLALLVLPVSGWRALVTLVTAFTAGHSLTLVAAALGLGPTAGWFPPLVESLIALSLVVAAVENVLASPRALAGRWKLVFAFGLVHGFGFAYALGDALQFAGGHVVPALAAFNLGVEAGQLAVLALLVPLFAWLRRVLPSDGVLGTRGLVLVGSALVAHTAWHWLAERWAVVQAYEFAWPALDAAFLAAAMRIGMLAALAGLLALALGALARRLGAGLPASAGAHSPRTTPT